MGSLIELNGGVKSRGMNKFIHSFIHDLIGFGLIIIPQHIIIQCIPMYRIHIEKHHSNEILESNSKLNSTSPEEIRIDMS